jgi:hypothetical protein
MFCFWGFQNEIWLGFGCEVVEECCENGNWLARRVFDDGKSIKSVCCDGNKIRVV